jgi:hypothetical protein
MAELPQRLAISLYQDARSYVECVPVLNQHLHELGKLFDPHQHQLGPPHKVPMYFLLCQAMELALKAHLAASGVPEKTLSSKKIRHKIDVAFRMARDDYGFVPADNRFPELVRWLAPYHRDHLFRYRKGNGLLEPPYALSVAAKIILKTVAGIEPYVRSQLLKAEGRSTIEVARNQLALDQRLERAAQLVILSRKFFDVWSCLEHAREQPATHEVMDAHFSEFFVFTLHAHFVAFVVHMAALFEKRQDTINLRRLINEMKTTAMLPSKAAAEIDALLAEAEPLATKVSTLRNNLFAHRSAFLSYAEIFEMADVTEDELRGVTEIALKIANQLLEAKGHPDQSFNPAPLEQAEALLRALLREHALTNR